MLSTTLYRNHLPLVDTMQPLCSARLTSKISESESESENFMTNNYNKDFIRSALPHGESFIFLESIEHFCPDTSTISSNIYIDPLDTRFDGHFEEEKIFPAVFQIEALAQLSGILHRLSPATEDSDKAFLTNSNIAFKNVIHPGSTVLLTSKIKTQFGATTEFIVSTSIDGKAASKGTLRLTSV